MLDETNSVRKDILEAARQVFSKYGYKKTTVNDIAKAAGKAKSSLYHYFESKEMIFVSIVKEELDGLVSRSMSEASRHHDPIEKLYAYIFTGRGSVGKISKEFGDILINDFFEFFPLIKEYVREHARNHVNLIKKIIDEGSRTGIFFTDDSLQSAKAFSVAFIGITEDSPLQDVLDIDIDKKTADRLFNMLIAGLMKK
ncbi:MAG TPA: TetR/AcrR family transcriptional regulator [bacterium]|nr:TetR/AcrR family transcriptional regulator [bacterium]